MLVETPGTCSWYNLTTSRVGERLGASAACSLELIEGGELSWPQFEGNESSTSTSVPPMTCTYQWCTRVSHRRTVERRPLMIHEPTSRASRAPPLASVQAQAENPTK